MVNIFSWLSSALFIIYYLLVSLSGTCYCFTSIPAACDLQRRFDIVSCTPATDEKLTAKRLRPITVHGVVENKEENEDENNDEEDKTYFVPLTASSSSYYLPKSPSLAAFVATLTLGATWLLALASGNDLFDSIPHNSLDVDTYLAVKGLLDGPTSDALHGGSLATTQDIASYTGYGGDPNTILELPSLSPAERLVGAVFGPPTPQHSSLVQKP
jgi:hypothetical protein